MKNTALFVFTTFALAAGTLSVADSCTSNGLGARALLQAKSDALGPVCEEMCKEIGVYPECQCPGFAGQPASADDTRACAVKYCQDPSNKCPNDGFSNCVAENSKVSALQWDAVMKSVDHGFASLMQAVRLGKAHGETASCSSKNMGVHALIQAKAQAHGPVCEEMCKEIGVYPECQCPGFAGQPASDDDTRACIVKYCQDPSNKCPNDGFSNCVAENSKVSALQWNAVMQSVDHGFESLMQTMRMAKAHAEATKCSKSDLGMRALLQAKVSTFGPVCEEMCKEIGVYPECQCPGFAGQPASADDTRACIVKYCQDPSNKCPNDGFSNCVAENSKVSALQWDAVMKSVDHGFESLLHSVRMSKNVTAARKASK